MSFIIEAAVIGSVASTLVSVVTAVIAKRNKKQEKDEGIDDLGKAEADLHEIIKQLKNKKGDESPEIKEHLSKLISEIKETEALLEVEHNKPLKQDK
ncbi:hypothetical protein [Pseudoalteromonas obscura]|uniref:Uncharacterized protein n=1 Tax=Pseudoalteromonas obscura TaxID=3048491 RepID=A0ABT7EE88_9GAMM|nr:hypothetical protein [Pseudoalteromonas sp. P94(2023)]MDK2593590.1 hypothetical protein [Pseudoalteromonas sp. P94(2023)]